MGYNLDHEVGLDVDRRRSGLKEIQVGGVRDVSTFDARRRIPKTSPRTIGMSRTYMC